MKNNIYSPPQADLKISDDRPGSAWKAILIGAAIDIGGSVILGIVVAGVFGFTLGAQGHSPEEVERQLTDLSPWSTLGIIVTLLGTLISAFAGYQCAAIAKRHGYHAPAAMALISVAFGLALGRDNASVWEVAAMAAITIAAVLSGAWLYNRNRSKP